MDASMENAAGGNDVTESENVAVNMSDDVVFLNEEMTAMIKRTLSNLPNDVVEWRRRVIAQSEGERRIEAGPRLPYELIGLVAEHLADQVADPSFYGSRRAQFAHAALNRVSRAVHQTTLPQLYERTTYRSAETFMKSVGARHPGGWAYIKYLHLATSTFPLLQQYCLLTSASCTSGENNDINVNPALPRLVIMVVVSNPTNKKAKHVHSILSGNETIINHTRDLRVELFKQIPMDLFVKLCKDRLPNHYTIKSICVVGIPLEDIINDSKTTHMEMANITDLIVRSGAGISPPTTKGVMNVTGAGIRSRPHRNFVLEVQDPVPNAVTRTTIDLVLGSARLIRYEQARRGLPHRSSRLHSLLSTTLPQRPHPYKLPGGDKATRRQTNI